MPERCFLIVNPTSGGFSERKLATVMEELGRRGFHPELLLTQCALDPELFARRICNEVASPTLLVAGGDGTLNGVINGLSPGVATLGVLPMGTSNVLARELRIASLEDALNRISRGERRAVSVGELDSCRGKRRFLLMAGIGVDGVVVDGVRLSEKRLWGKGAYVLSAVRALLGWERQELLVTLAGRSVRCHSVIVCNAAKYAGNFILAPGGDIFVPGFQVLCILEKGRLAYLKLALLLAAGRVAASRSVALFSAQELEVSGEKPVQVDGDPCHRSPVSIKAIPSFFRVIV